ncbi:MAG: hypothetical protein HPY82_05920 [Gammaproteobacteria bacterium]|nr:hypothetical protein [Gammaproteobacteria bacterium]
MIAAIEREHQVVWGIGRTASAAINDANRCMKTKPQFKVGKLELATLSPDADLGADGETLWQWVQDSAPVQDGLF